MPTQQTAEIPSASPALAPRVVVIGCGVAGLAATLELSAKGMAVTALERGAVVGGKLRQLDIRDDAGALRGVDSGPTVFTMKPVFEALFEAVGENLDSVLPTRRLKRLARHAWVDDGATLDLHADAAESEAAIADFAGREEARRFRAFSARARHLHRALEPIFIQAQKPSPLQALRRAPPTAWRLAPLLNLWRELGRHFKDPRLRQLFGRYATYCGSSPFRAPATLMLIAQVEQEGVWSVQGGMRRIAETLAALAQARGATLRTDAPVAEILVRGGAASGVRLVGGEIIDADAVVFAGDASALGAGLLGEATTRAARPTPPAARSLSALTLSLVGRAEGLELLRHNVFFSSDYQREFNEIFRDGRIPNEPTVYVCAQDREDSGGTEAAIPGLETPRADGRTTEERLLLLANAPAAGDARDFPDDEIETAAEAMAGVLKRCGLDMKVRTEAVRTTAPDGFDALFPGTGGALYGRASHGPTAPFQRPGARSRLPRLYLAGGSVHPGPGVPMATLSGRMAAARVIEDLRGRFHPSARPEPSPAPKRRNTPPPTAAETVPEQTASAPSAPAKARASAST